MQPTLEPGRLVIAARWLRPSAGSIVIARHDGRDIIKRVQNIADQRATLVGDNPSDHHNALVDVDQIVGRVIYPFGP